MSNFQPVNSNPADGELITLCKILESVSTGSGGGNSDVAVGADGTTRVPLNVNSAGELKVNVEANIDADLAHIETDLATTNGILTTTAADTATIKADTATIKADTATIKADTGTIKADTGTIKADTATIKAEILSIDNKIPSLSSGRVPVESNNTATQVYNYTATGTVAINTVLIGPIECSQFREVALQITSVATGSVVLQISNDSSSWRGVAYLSDTGQVQQTGVGSVGIYNYQLLSARFFRVIQSTAQTAGTTTLVAYASQQATPKMYQSVTISSQVSVIPQPSPSNGFNTYHTLVSTASTNATSVRASAGQIGTLILTNTSATWAYFKLVNKASAPTTGTDTAIINIGVAPNTTQDCSMSFAGLRMTTGIAYYISSGVSLTDNTALPMAGTFLVNMTYA